MAGFAGHEDETYKNAPNASLMYQMYTPTFGFGAFDIIPPLVHKGDIGEGFPTIPYLPLEALIYQQQASNPVVSPYNIVGGSNAGQQQTAGLQTAKDANNITRYGMGYFNG